MSKIRHGAALTLTAIAAAIGLLAVLPGGAGATTTDQVFSAPGPAAFVVPAGVTEITVDAYGAAGGTGSGGSGQVGPAGLGGRTTATISVTPGETLQVNVGGVGQNDPVTGTATGGTNGGGSAGGPGAGAGGGASDVRQGGAALGNRVVVAGGGGGGGYNQCTVAEGGVGGGDLPTAGGDGSFVTGGGPGGASAGGAGGSAGSSGGAGTAGAAGQGGTGGSSNSGFAAGGGGAGWFGGGGGGGDFTSAGGGGGSGYVLPGATSVAYQNGVRAGDGRVVLSWEAPATTTTTSTTFAPSTTSTVAPGPSAGFGGSTTGSVAVPGGPVTIRSAGWQPGSLVTATLYSDPVVLGTVTVGPDGAFSASFSVPTGTPVGLHQIVLTGIGASGGAASATLALTVNPTSAPAATPVPARLSFTC